VGRSDEKVFSGLMDRRNFDMDKKEGSVLV
jgi:hypothetical protein